MALNLPPIALESAIDLTKITTSGSILEINDVYEEVDCPEKEPDDSKPIEYIGEPVNCFESFAKHLVPCDADGMVRKRFIEEGGGELLNEECTVSIAYAGYWEKDPYPFDYKSLYKPLVVDMKDNGLLPGLQIAINSMLVGEMSVFLLSYKVMYGEMGILGRIKPKADCVFYIKLIKSIKTPKDKKIIFSEPNMFQRVHHEVKQMYSSGITLHKLNNISAAINLFRKAVFMLHKVRLANKEEEQVQEKLLKKLYMNLAICYVKVKQPLKACTACNELNRINNLWNNSKALFINAKALRMIGQFDDAEKRLRRSIKLSPNHPEMDTELKLLENTRETFNKNNLFFKNYAGSSKTGVNREFKREIDDLITNFKNNDNVVKLTLPEGLSNVEIEYIKEACKREKLYCNKIEKQYALDRDNDKGDCDTDVQYLL